MIAQMYQDAAALRDAELHRLRAACPDLPEAQRQAVQAMTERLLGRLMHPCAMTLREHALSGPAHTLAQGLRELALRSGRAPHANR